MHWKKRLRAWLCLTAALVLAAGIALGEVYIEQEKPADWEERDLLRIYALYSLDCDAYILQCGGQTMVLDGGKNASYLTEFLEEHNLQHVDMIFNSHPHDDHIDAVYHALRNDRMTTDLFLSPFREDYRDASDTFHRRVVKVLEQKEIPYRQVFSGDELTLGDTKITVYRYDGETKKTDGRSMMINDMSGILWVRYGESAILMTADIGGTIQQMLAKEYGTDKLKSDILTAPHHGKNAMNGDLLRTVAPKLVIITGKVARTQACIRQMNREGVAWKRTSYGTVLMETDGKDWYVNQDYSSEKVKKQEKAEQKKK